MAVRPSSEHVIVGSEARTLQCRLEVCHLCMFIYPRVCFLCNYQYPSGDHIIIGSKARSPRYSRESGL